MDARITKQRLKNMLSYDWLKIVGAIVAAALVLVLFFTMIATRATAGQTFEIYAYNDVSAGTDFVGLPDNVNASHAFSYEILDVSTESITNSKLYGNSVFLARRAAGEGRVIFLSDYHETDEEGNAQSSTFDALVKEGVDEEKETQTLFLDPEVFMGEVKSYLCDVFGTLDGELSEEKARELFLARNKKDKRFRTSTQKKKGILQEQERLNKLKEDYLCVADAMEEGVFSYAVYTAQNGKEYKAGFRLGGLVSLNKLIYYTVDGVQKAEEMTLCLFNNGTREGDLKYDTVSFLAYLIRTYGATR